uniref:Prokineticin domain-containing protein n=1 Tax=Ciona savignyi TaxID=51511 RepID=H2Z3I3_CIOSA
MCVFGRCKLAVNPGSVGTLCEVSEDCDDGLCCAEVSDFPRLICKPYAKQGERCSVPPVHNPIEFISIPTDQFFCPCVSSLKCVSRDESSASDTDYNTPLFCEVPRINTDNKSSIEKERDLLSRLFPDLIVPHWQQRMETEDDQRFSSQLGPNLHKTTKKAMGINELVM